MGTIRDKYNSPTWWPGINFDSDQPFAFCIEASYWRYANKIIYLEDKDGTMTPSAERGFFVINGLHESDGRVTFNRYYDGNDYVIHMTITSLDLDGGGVNDDSLSWKLHVQGWRWVNRSCSNGVCQMTGGTPNQRIYTGYVDFGVIDNVLLGSKRESIVFKIEDIVLTADVGFTATFNGFNRMWLTEGIYIFGRGKGLPCSKYYGGNGLKYIRNGCGAHCAFHQTLLFDIEDVGSDGINHIGVEMESNGR